MADPAAPESPRPAPAPALLSTADETPYVPVSWLAVAAAGSATLLGALIAIMGLFAFRSHRPLLEFELFLFLAVLAIVLSFAARRVIRNSEGTRTGLLFSIDLPNYAWWGGLVLGLGYLSYFLAIEFSIGRDAKSEVQAWSEHILKGDEESMNRAFHRTQDPGQRKPIKPVDGAQLEARWGKEYIAFHQSDLRRLIARNGAADCKFELGGLREWKYMPFGIECVYTATLTCPEGTFPLMIPMKGVEVSATGGDSSGGRQWQILHSPAIGFIDKDRAKLTQYGWMVAHLGVSGSSVSQTFISGASSARELRATLFTEFVSKDPAHDAFFQPLKVGGVFARAAAFGFPAAMSFTPGPKFLDYASERLYKLKDGAVPDSARLDTFKKAWFETGIVKAGERLRESTDVNDAIIFTPDTILYRMPIEIPLTATQGNITAARGALILECTDPNVIAEVKRLRASADPKITAEAPEVPLGSRSIPWRVLRIESDLKPIRMEPPKKPGAPGAPGGGGEG